MCSFNSGNSDGANSSKTEGNVSVVFVYVLYLCKTDWFCGLICEMVYT